MPDLGIFFKLRNTHRSYVNLQNNYSRVLPYTAHVHGCTLRNVISVTPVCAQTSRRRISGGNDSEQTRWQQSCQASGRWGGGYTKVYTFSCRRCFSAGFSVVSGLPYFWSCVEGITPLPPGIWHHALLQPFHNHSWRLSAYSSLNGCTVCVCLFFLTTRERC